MSVLTAVVFWAAVALLIAAFLCLILMIWAQFGDDKCQALDGFLRWKCATP